MSVIYRAGPGDPTHLQIPTSLFNEDRWRRLSADHQHAFLLLCLRREHGSLGHLPLLMGRYSYGTPDLSGLELMERVRRLALWGWVVIDETEDELFIPRFMEFNQVAKNPNRLKAAIQQADDLDSPLVRAAVADVLADIARADAQRAAKAVRAGTTAARPRNRPNIPRLVRSAVYLRDGWACVYCRREFEPVESGAPEDQLAGVWLELDHVQPYSMGGDDTFENLRAACSTCNRRRGVDDLDLWADRIAPPEVSS